MKKQIFKLHGQMQYYAWGGYSFIPELLGFDNAQHKPCAEYWMGTHSGGPARIETEDGTKIWGELIRQNPEKYLGNFVYQKFGELPYLFKILDVRDMLSIQVHPTKEEAAKGFDAEEKAGIPITAPDRNYKDRNHKPEVMVALGDFWLLHGFKKEKQLKEILQSIPEFNFLLALFENKGYEGIYRQIMEMPQSEADAILLPVIKRAFATAPDKDNPDFWVKRLYENAIPQSNIDRGIFSIYFFNIVKLKKGEAIFQAAGIPHAYLEGQNVELMANSDNVLRGGLTPKHIDVPELLKHTLFKGIEPEILHPINISGEMVYKMPVDDFGISEIQLDTGREHIGTSKSPELYLITEGVVYCDGMHFKTGEVILIIPDTTYTIRAVENAQLFKAYVPV